MLDSRPNKRGLDQSDFLELFRVLTDLPEYRAALKQANGGLEESLNAKQLAKFLGEQQKVRRGRE